MVNVCLLGTGYIARIHAMAYVKNKNANICAVCDMYEEQVESFAKEFGIKNTYTSFAEMLENEKTANALDICIAPCDHAPRAIQALNHGLHVLCEKPVALNAEETAEMVRIAKENNKLLMVAFVTRFSPQVIAAKEMIDDGFLGKVYYTRVQRIARDAKPPRPWSCTKSISGGGPVMDLGIHGIDCVRYLMGNPKPLSVYAIGYSEKCSDPENYCDVEDFASALIKYDNGAATLVETSYQLNSENRNYYDLFGTDGGITIQTMEKDAVTLHSKQGKRLINSVIDESSYRKYKPLFEAEIDHFVECIEENKPCISSGDDGLDIMKIIDAIYKSIETGTEIKL